MNDLISRKVVMEYLQEQQAKVIIEKNKGGFVSKEVCDGMQSAVNAFMNFIVQCPTAYDVDKVVQTLDMLYLGKPTPYEYDMAIRDAIRVVRKGGIE